jgi:hypothetical protein
LKEILLAFSRRNLLENIMNTKDSENSGYYPLELALLQGESKAFKQLLLLGGNSFNNWENKKVKTSSGEDTTECLPLHLPPSSLSSSTSSLFPPTLSSTYPPPFPFPPMLEKELSPNILHTAVIGGSISSLNYLLKWIRETETDRKAKMVNNENKIRGENEISDQKSNDKNSENENNVDNKINGKGKNNREIVEQSQSVISGSTHTHSPSLSSLLGGRDGDGDGKTPLQLAKHLNKVYTTFLYATFLFITRFDF